MALTIGLRGTAERTVTPENTAAACGSGSLPVFGTPFMLAMMEEATCTAISTQLEDGQSTVGISMDIQHTAPSPVGMAVRAEATLTEVNGKMLTFAVTAYDQAGEIGSGTIRRCIIRSESFLSRCQSKLK
jgi:fluoroacetyl-CoA thioesterase